MAQIDTLVQNFLAQKRIAVVGVSNTRPSGANFNFDKFKAKGYEVYPVSPNATTFQGQPCYPDLKSIPVKPDAVFVFASPKVGEIIARQCVELGIKHLWMQQGAESEEAVALCREKGIAAVAGKCLLMHTDAGFPHSLHRWAMKLVGKY